MNQSDKEILRRLQEVEEIQREVVFDALGSDRCYKKAWDDERIFAMFKEERGEHFDPDLIDIFFEHLDEFLEIRDSLKDTIS